MEKTQGDEVKGAQGNLEDMQPEAQLDFSILKGMKVNKMGKIVDEQVCFLLLPLSSSPFLLPPYSPSVTLHSKPMFSIYKYV